MNGGILFMVNNFDFYALASLIEIHSSLAHKNTAQINGGILYLAYLSNLSIQNSNFTYNKASLNGGVTHL